MHSRLAIELALVALCAASVVAEAPRGSVPPRGGSILASQGIGEASFAPFLGTIRERRAQWLQKAEAATPVLRHRTLQAKRIVSSRDGRCVTRARLQAS